MILNPDELGLIVFSYGQLRLATSLLQG